MPIEFYEPESEYQKIFVGGFPGAGKTRWARTWPNVVYLDAEGRLKSVAKDKPRRWPVSSSSDIEDFLRVMKRKEGNIQKAMGGPVDTINVDTIDEIARMLIDEQLTKADHESMQQSDWGVVKDQIGDIIRAFRNLDCHVLFACHLSDRVIDEESGRTEAWPQIQGSMREEIFNFVDVAVRMEAKTRRNAEGEYLERAIKTFPDARHPWVKEHNGAIPNGFEINFEDDYERMMKAIHGFVPEPRQPLSQEEIDADAKELAEMSKELKAKAKETEKAESTDEEADVRALRQRSAPKSKKAKEAAEKDAPKPKAKAAEKDAEPKEEPKEVPTTVIAAADSSDEDKATADIVVGESAPEPDAVPAPDPVPEPDAVPEAAPAPEPDTVEETETAPDEPREPMGLKAEDDQSNVDPTTGEVAEPEAATPSEPEAEQEPTTESVPEDGTEDAAEGPAEVYICNVCGDEIADEDIAILSKIRYKERLCPVHFAAAKKGGTKSKS